MISNEQIKALQKAEETIAWSLDLITMYDDFLVSLGEPSEKIKSVAHQMAISDAVLSLMELTKVRIDLQKDSQ